MWDLYTRLTSSVRLSEHVEEFAFMAQVTAKFDNADGFGFTTPCALGKYVNRRLMAEIRMLLLMLSKGRFSSTRMKDKIVIRSALYNLKTDCSESVPLWLSPFLWPADDPQQCYSGLGCSVTALGKLCTCSAKLSKDTAGHNGWTQ